MEAILWESSKQGKQQNRDQKSRVDFIPKGVIFAASHYEDTQDEIVYWVQVAHFLLSLRRNLNLLVLSFSSSSCIVHVDYITDWVFLHHHFLLYFSVFSHSYCLYPCSTTSAFRPFYYYFFASFPPYLWPLIVMFVAFLTKTKREKKHKHKWKIRGNVREK